MIIKTVEQLMELNQQDRINEVVGYLNNGLFDELKKTWGITAQIQIYPKLKKLGIKDEIHPLIKQINETSVALENVKVENIQQSQKLNLIVNNEMQFNEDKPRRGRRKGTKNKKQKGIIGKSELMRFNIQGDYNSTELTERLRRIVAFLEESDCTVKTKIQIEVS